MDWGLCTGGMCGQARGGVGKWAHRWWWLHSLASILVVSWGRGVAAAETSIAQGWGRGRAPA